MLTFIKEQALQDRNMPFGALEVQYPDRAAWDEAAFRALAERELAALRERYADYDRKAVFGDDPYFRFFKKFKKTYPVMMQFESFLLKGWPFPNVNPITEVPFLLELTTHVLSGTHDVDHIEGPVVLRSGTEKETFTGLRGNEVHTYPNDMHARDDKGIILCMLSGADKRTCARPNSTHVFYPVFGTPDMPEEVITRSLAQLERYVHTLAQAAETKTILL